MAVDPLVFYRVAADMAIDHLELSEKTLGASIVREFGFVRAEVGCRTMDL